MRFRVLLLAGAALLLALPATAKEKHKYKHKHKEVERTCVCAMGYGPGAAAIAPVAPLPALPAIPAIPPNATWRMHVPHPGAPHVMVFRDDGDERVVIVRKHGKHGKHFMRHRDSADENGDGEVSRREFMRRAEKHFEERDRDNDGTLDDDEMEPMEFTVPMPPEPPEPPMPPDPEDD